VRISDALTAWPAVALALAGLEPRAADQTMREVGSSALTADWGIRALSRYHPDYNPLLQGNGAISSYLTGMTALAHYRAHRAWAGHDLLRDLGRVTFDFARGRTPARFPGLLRITRERSAAEHGRKRGARACCRGGLFGVAVDAPTMRLPSNPTFPPSGTPRA
jgi:hypothetical protein